MTQNETAGGSSGRRPASPLGQYGERLAERHLIAAGMTVLDRNWHCAHGEIDLVLRDDAVLVVCEVKTRRDARFGHPLEAIDAAKTARLHLLAAMWQQEHGVRPADVRLDAVGILRPRRGATVLEHVRGIG